MVRTRDDPLFTSSAGYSNLSPRERLAPTDGIGIGSITKTFVAVVALQLVEDGSLNLKATVRNTLGPEISRDIANAGTATLADLMNHTSGIPSWEDDPRWIRDGRGDHMDSNHVWAKSETLDYIRGQPALFSPGERYSYSNTNYTLIGVAIEQTTGNSLAAEIARRICLRLGLTHVYMEKFSDPIDATPRAHRYHYATPAFLRIAGLPSIARDIGGGLVDVTAANLSCEWAAGGMVSTSIDLARFFQGLRDGCLLSPESMAFMQAWRQAGTLPSGEPFFVGHGLFRQPAGGQWLVGNTGSVLGSTACAFWIEGTSTVFAVLSNIGIEDIGDRKPNASSVGLDPRFLSLVRELSSRGLK